METLIGPQRVWKMPPLILHPFSDASGPNKLLESSRASLMLQGLLPAGEYSPQELEQKLVEGRFCELRMLFYLGRDLDRWIEQCLEVVERDETLRRAGIKKQSFRMLLVEDPPENIREKLKSWGVSDYKAIFTRAIGLNAVFAEMPDQRSLHPEFIRNYYRYADHMFACSQQMTPFTQIRSRNFQFDLFASGEYTRMLERQWDLETS
ncbi:MAG: hypothetical protein NZV14_01395 [Bryobacteraceae bacterium]|nr:hypothetical protein [Bryobacteraceae bacterium]MDW8376784.1 hypothetical protein [Bryobacterales bacterium]